MKLYMKSIRNIFHKQIFSNFYLHLIVCLLILSISCWSLFYYDTYPVAQSESGIFFYPSYIFTQNLKNWSEFYLGARNSIHQSYQTFIFRFLITPDISINPFYIQFSYYLIMFYLGFLGMYKSINLYNINNKILNLYLSTTYIFNPVSAFFLLRFQYPYITLYYLFPLIFYLTYKAISSNNLKNFLKYTFLTFVLLALFSIIYAAMPTLFLLFFFWLFFSIFFLFFKFLKNPNETIKILIKRILPFFIIWLLVNLYWFIPFLVELNNPNTLIPVKEVLNKDENVQTFIFFSNRDSDFFSIISLITKEFLNFLNRRVWFQYIIFMFSLIPLSIILVNFFEIFKRKSLYFKKINFNIFLLISLLSVFLLFLRGANEPFGKFIKYIFINIPIFQVLRNPFEKLTLIYTFFFILLFCISFINLFSKYKSLRFFLATLLFSYIFFVSHKMFNSKLLLGPFPPFDSSKQGFKLKIPESYKLISKEINSTKIGISRTLLVPTVQEGITYNWDKGYIGVDFIQNFISNDAYSFVSPDSYEDRKQLILNVPYAYDKPGVLQLLGFKNVIFRNDFDYFSREIINPIKAKEYLTMSFEPSSFETVPLKNIHLIFSEEKYNQTNFGRSINLDPPYRVPMDWTRNVYFRFNLPLESTLPAKTSYKFTISFSEPNQEINLFEFKANNNRRRVSFTDIQKNESMCQNCFSSNFIYTEDTRPVNSFEIFAKLSLPAQFLVIDNVSISYYNSQTRPLSEIVLIKDYPKDKLSHYKINKDLPVFLSPKKIQEISNYSYLLNNDIDVINKAYLIVSKNPKSMSIPKDTILTESNINYKKISNSEYDIEITPKEATTKDFSTLLTFNFSADSLWKLTRQDEYFKFTNNSFLFEDRHFITNTYANTWLLENIPSTGIKLKLIYAPKIYFNLFYPISIIVSVVISLYLIYLVLKDFFNARISK